MADEYFYGATLGEAGASVTWEQLGNTKAFPSPFYKLILRQILLGHTAKEDEYNVVEVETASVNDNVKVPIAILKVGETRSVQTVLEFPDAPVTFKLVEGSGPVYIHGQQIPSHYEIESIETMPEEQEYSEEEGESEEDEENASKKQNSTTNNSKNANNKNNKKK